MNKTKKSLHTHISVGSASNVTFRTLVKNRLTHHKIDSQSSINKNHTQLIENKLQQQSFQQAKNNLKKYIQSMKATSKVGNFIKYQNKNKYEQQQQKQSRLPSSRVDKSSRKLVNKSLSSIFSCVSEINDKKSTENFNEKLGIKPARKDIRRYFTTNNQQNVDCCLPEIQKLQTYEEVEDDEYMRLKPKQTSQRQKLQELQSKIQLLLSEKLKVQSSECSFSRSIQNRNTTRLLQKQMDRILQQIKRFKLAELSSSNEMVEGLKQKEINRNIQMFEKKVKIIQRLIAQKLFQSDNLKNRYLQKIKQQRRNISEPFNRKSKSSAHDRQPKNVNPSEFKPLNMKKEAVIHGQMTTNRLSYKTPLNSYYIVPKKDKLYNRNMLTQPMPRSTYNRQYLVYSPIPKSSICVGVSRRDHKIFDSNLSSDQQRSLLRSSTYKDEFIGKIEKQPINFRQFDCYRDKFKSLQVNFSRAKNDNKVVGNNQLAKLNIQDRRLYNSRNRNQNPQLTLTRDKIKNQGCKMGRLNQSVSNVQQTQQKSSMIKLQSIQKQHLFNQRIKSQIKHKNISDQKQRFKRQLLKEKNKMLEQSTKNQKLLRTIQH